MGNPVHLLKRGKGGGAGLDVGGLYNIYSGRHFYPYNEDEFSFKVLISNKLSSK